MSRDQKISDYELMDRAILEVEAGASITGTAKKYGICRSTLSDHVRSKRGYDAAFDPDRMSRKIYFAGSMRGGRQDTSLYYKIIEHLKTYGQVLTEFVGMEKESGNLTDKEIYDRDMAMLHECNCLVAEVTQPSLGVGFEIGRAVALGKTILCLYRPQEGRSLSAMITGAENGTNFRVKYYSGFEEVPAIVKEFISSLS